MYRYRLRVFQVPDVLEHVTWEELVEVLQESLQFLVKNGEFQIAHIISNYFVQNTQVKGKFNQKLALLFVQIFAKNGESVQSYKILRKFVEPMKDQNKLWPLISILINRDECGEINQSA